PPADGARPLAAARASRFAENDSTIRDRAARARQVWLAEGPWRVLPVTGAFDAFDEVTEPSAPAGSGGLCATERAGATRWTRLAPGARARVTLLPPDRGTHQLVILRADGSASAPGEVRIDDTSVPLHGDVALDSIVAVRPGTHDLSNAAGGSPV